MGVHWIGPGGFGDLLDSCREVQPPLVLVVNELDKVVLEVRSASPHSFIVARLKGPSWPDAMPILGNKSADYFVGERRFNDWYAVYKGIGADAYVFANEWLSQDDPGLLAAGCSAYMGLMDAAPPGVIVTIGDFNTGQPQLERPEILDAIRPMLDQAQAEGHLLNIHLYPIGGDLIGDYERLVRRWARVFDEYPRLRVIVGEYAPDVRGDGGELLMRTGDQVLKRWPQIIGAARFTLGQGWEEFHFDRAAYRRYVRGE